MTELNDEWSPEFHLMRHLKHLKGFYIAREAVMFSIRMI
jgi:hypothetical protein